MYFKERCAWYLSYFMNVQGHKHSLKLYTTAASRIIHIYSDIHNAAGEE